MTRVTDLAQFNTALFYLSQTQGRISDEQSQVSSGIKSQNYTGMAGDASRLVTMETTHARATQYTANNTLVAGRLQSMEGSISQIFDVATDLKTLLVNALNDQNASSLALSQQADAKLQQVAGLLNTKLDSRYLFAGSRTEHRAGRPGRIAGLLHDPDRRRRLDRLLPGRQFRVLGSSRRCAFCRLRRDRRMSPASKS